MRWALLYRFTLSAIFLAGALLMHAQSPEKPFYLHDNDTVVFYGDSITEQRYYTGWVEVYAATRFPHMPIQFFSVGVGGDRVTGGGGGPIDERLSRDLFPLKPTVVTILLGMNDGGYGPLKPEIESKYTAGYEHILDSIQQSLPGTRVTLLGPSPYDDVTRPVTFPGGYNATLTHFSDLDSQLALKHSDTFIDLNAPFVESLKRGMAMDPLAIELLVPDRVHPEPMAHWFMAAAILKGWNAPSIVSSATIDAGKQTVVATVRSHVTDLSADAKTVSWKELDDALPLPLDDKNIANHFLLQISDIQRDLNQQPLTVQGLKPGSYRLTIDGVPIGNFSDADFAHGINLTDFATPMRGQAFAVSWMIRDRDDAHYVRLRMLINQMKYSEPSEPGAASLLQFESQLQKHIYETAQPKPHKFQLTLLESPSQ
jgi:lysophospholipase L1-like esterase